MTILYDVGLYIFLLYLVIDIAILGYFLFKICSININLLFFNNIMIFIDIILFGLFLGFIFYASAFNFSTNILFRSYLINNFNCFSDLVIYDLVAITTYFI